MSYKSQSEIERDRAFVVSCAVGAAIGVLLLMFIVAGMSYSMGANAGRLEALGYKEPVDKTNGK